MSSCKVNKTHYSLGLFDDELAAYEAVRLATAAAEAGTFVPPKRTYTAATRGVYYWKIGKCWRAEISHQKQRFYLGFFPTEEEASNAVAEARKGLAPARTRRSI